MLGLSSKRITGGPDRAQTSAKTSKGRKIQGQRELRDTPKGNDAITFGGKKELQYIGKTTRGNGINFNWKNMKPSYSQSQNH